MVAEKPAERPGEAGGRLAGSEVREWRTGAHTGIDGGGGALTNCHTTSEDLQLAPLVRVEDLGPGDAQSSLQRRYAESRIQ